jgi:hypothetical protein
MEVIKAHRDGKPFIFEHVTNDGHIYHCAITEMDIEPAYSMPDNYLVSHGFVLKSIDFSISDISFHYEIKNYYTVYDIGMSKYLLPYFVEFVNCVLNKTDGFNGILSADDGIINFIKSVINAFQDDAVKELFDEFVVRVWLNPNIFAVTNASFLLIKELHHAHKDYLFKHLTMGQRNAMLSICDTEQEYELKAELVHYSNPINPSDDKDRWTL